MLALLIEPPPKLADVPDVPNPTRGVIMSFLKSSFVNLVDLGIE